MADEPVSQAAPSAPTAVSSPLSSPAPAPSAPVQSDTPAAAASAPTPASPDGTPPKTDAAPARPDGIPDSYWDAEKNTLKLDPAALAKDLRERDELKAFKAAEDIKAQARPKTADEYKLELPADYKPAVDAPEFVLDKADPFLAAARAEALAQGMSQAGFSKMLGLYAGVKSAEAAQVAAGLKAEQGKLGANAGQRVDSVLNFITGLDTSADKGDAKALAAGLVTARQVEAWERLITRITSQGSASFSQSHRVPADDKAIPGYDKMSFEQRRLAQDQRAAARRTA